MCCVVALAVSGCGSDSADKRNAKAATASGTPSVSASATPSADQTAAVALVFKTYKAAVLAKDGPAAVDVVANTTYEFYDQARVSALDASKQELAALAPAKRMTALVMRGSLQADVLRSSTPKQLLVAAVDAGLIGEDGVKSLEIGQVQVSGESATAAAKVRGAATDFDLAFVRQDGQWKFDLLPLLDVGTRGFETAAKQQGMTVNEFIDAALEQQYGQEKFAQIVSRPLGR
jgi:hypothetical protein